MAEGSGGLLDAVTGGARQIGPYFSVLSGLTSVVLVGFPVLLLAAGAPGRRPDLAILGAHLRTGVNLTAVIAFGVLVLVAAITMHPLQFATTQLLEGYWGHGRLQRRAMSRSQRQHLDKWSALADTFEQAEKDLDLIDDELNRVKKAMAQAGPLDLPALQLEQRRLEERRIEPSVRSEQAGIALSRYPVSTDQLMATRLGNVLRRHERQAGEPFGLDAVTVIPYLAQVAEQAERDYLDDARSALDLPVRMVLIWSICTAEGILLLWRYDYWLLLSLVTYALAYIAYRGAISAAARYGVAMRVVLTLGRKNLYERVSIKFPPDLFTEAHRNRSLTKLLAGNYVYVEFSASGGRAQSPGTAPD